MDARTSRYHDVYARSMRDPEGFWGEQAEAIDWIEKPKKIFDKNAGIYGHWFVGGVCNTCWNAVDRHVKAGRGGQAVPRVHEGRAGATVDRYATIVPVSRRRNRATDERGIAGLDAVVAGAVVLGRGEEPTREKKSRR